MRRNGTARSPTHVRCAVYTRKSTEEGLEQEFNSLDAQREAGEAFVASQKAEGWVSLPDRYDDGGYTGGNIERPALQRLLADIEARRIDCVVVYKVDRLSRSLLDFARVMETFERHSVSFVSVTQQFNTSTSMGRLMLNVLLSFAQFEREIISERTRDKIAAARRKGKWSGGHPVLGYDLVRKPGGSHLVVNAKEAERVRAIFGHYLECESIMATIRRLQELGWTTKAWSTKRGCKRGGRPFDKSRLAGLLSNVVYLGKVRYREEVHDGEHQAIVDQNLFYNVQAILRRNHRSGGSHIRNKHGALLKGLVRCGACGCRMSPTYASRGNRRYRYYLCANAQRNGWRSCPAPSLPAAQLEQFVIDQIRRLGQDDSIIADAIRETRRQLQDEIESLRAERKSLARRVKSLIQRQRRLATGGSNGRAAGGLADVQARLQQAEREATQLDDRIAQANRHLIDEDELIGALESFDPVWEALAPAERRRLIRLLVREVTYDAERDTVALTFHATGIPALAAERKR